MDADIVLPLATGTVAHDLTALFALLVAAKLGEELFSRLHQPQIVGAILGGVIIGPSAMGLVGDENVIALFAELGVIFLLFWVGLESRISDISAVGRDAASVGVLGVVIPAVSGSLLAIAFGASTSTALFLGAALAATSVGITSAILVDRGLHDGRAGRTILGAAVIDDVLALVLLSVASGVAATGGIDAVEILGVVAVTASFLIFVAVGGSKLLRRHPQILIAPRSVDTPLLPAVIICLGLAVLSQEIGLAAVVGAFMAGMIVAETRVHNAVETEVAPLNQFFAPFFFGWIGTLVDLGAFRDGQTLALFAGITVLAILTKYIGAWLGAYALDRADRRIVAAGMIPRGEVGVIVAGIGLTSGVVEADLFAVVVAMSVATTLLAPYMIRAPASSTG